MKVYPIGYSTPGAKKRIDELTKQNNVLLMDTRLKPYSWNDEWRQGQLEDRYGNTYHWCGKHLGNVNYQGGPIKLADPDVGIYGLIGYLKAGYDLILLCKCEVLTACHVKEICRLLLEKMSEVEVVKFGEVAADTIKCISIKQPWAWLIANGFKDIENRDWETDYRGPLLIHAGKEVDKDYFIGDEIYFDFFEQFGSEVVDALPRYKRDYALGSIVGQADLVDVVQESESQWFCGTYGFVLGNARPIGPIPYRGALKLFDVPRSIIEQARQSIPETRESLEPERIIICQRSGKGKGCTMTWAVGDRCSLNNSPAIIRETKMEGLTQYVRIKMAIDAPLLGRRLLSDHPKWIDGGLLKPRGTIIPEFGEHDE